MTPQYIHGFHDPGGEDLMAARPGWIVFTEEIGAAAGDHGGRDYRPWADRGFGVIVRLNFSHHGQGTIPRPERYDAFAETCANFVAGSQGCSHFIVGNEPNCIVERYDKQTPIMPESYADCFRRVCRAVIAKLGPAPNYRLMPAAIGPYNADTGDWVEYHRRVLIGCQEYADGVAIHCYAHGASPELITSEAKMDPPYQERRYNFRAYRDFVDAIPPTLRGLPIFITEFDQYDAWLDQNNGQVQAAYLEIDRWNQTPGTQKIHCLALYRWPKQFDQWGIEDKPQVQAAFRQAVALGYRVPTAAPVTPAATDHRTWLPGVYADAPTAPEPTPTPTPLPKLIWDARLTQRHVNLIPYAPQPGETYWRLIAARYYDVQEAKALGPDHHVLVDTRQVDGIRVVGVAVTYYWADDFETKPTEEKPGEPYAVDFAMYASGNSYHVRIGDNSDRVEGMGMGTVEEPHVGHHVSYGLVFERVTAPTMQVETPTGNGATTTEPTPVTTPTDIIDPLVAEAVLVVESGGAAFGPDGRLVIRLEAHQFRTYLRNDAQWALYFRVNEDRQWTGQLWRTGPNEAWRQVHLGSNDFAANQAAEWAAFEFAAKIDRTAALMAISMGSGQIMGFHHARIGYASVAAMFAAFGRREAVQVLGFVNYVLSDPALMEAIRQKDFRAVAVGYNGTGQADAYAAQMAAAYAKLVAAS